MHPCVVGSLLLSRFIIINFKKKFMDADNLKGFWGDHRCYYRKTVLLVGALLSFFLLAKTLVTLKEYATVGRDYPAQNVITLSGKGEVVAVPDLAEITFEVREEAKEVPDAQKKVTDKMNAVIAELKAAGIAERDIKTASYNIYPKYEYRREICPAGGDCYYPLPGRQVIVGYEAAHGLQVKVRKVADAGSILAKLGSLKVSNLSGINFSIDNEEELKAEARRKAIADARKKAENLAKDLNVRLVRIVDFSESGSYPPIYYARSEAALNKAGALGAPIPPPEVPTGENKIISNVSITYEIR